MRKALLLVVICLLAVPCPAEIQVGDELLANGGFDKLDGRGRPVGWRWVAGAHVRKEKANAWVEIDRYGAVGQDLAIDPNWMKLKVRFRMRVTGVQRGDEGWKNARLAMQWVDAAGKHVDPWPDVLWAEGTTRWQPYERVFLIPRGAATLQFTPAMFGKPGGKVEYDDLSVTLVRLRATKKEDLPAPDGYEKAWDLADAWRARSATRETVCLNGLWRFLPVPDGNAAAPPTGPQGWGWFNVPGVWPRAAEGGPQDLHISPYMEDRTDLERLDQAWYEREVAVPKHWAGRRVAIDLGLVQTHARVFLDGREAGAAFFPGGEVDLTRHIRPGAVQTLAILVTARPLEKERTVFMAPDRAITSKASISLRGLTGDVMLVSRPAGESLDDVRISTFTRNSMIRVDARIGGYGGKRRVLRARVLEKGKLVKEIASGPMPPGHLQGGLACLTARWADAKRWDLHTPGNLYDLVLRLEDSAGGLIDETLPIRFGFREFRIDGRDFTLNDKRIHLRALFGRNINGQADLACIEACRRTCRRIKAYGFNHLITANYHFQPGAVGYMDGLFSAADEEGVLCSFSLPHFRDFNYKLNTPAQAARYRALCEWLIRRARHHPSVVMYAMSHNATGYKGDQNPLRIDGIFDPEDPNVGGRPNRNRAQARLAAAIAKSIDPTRPVYHHQSGNLGDVYTLNIYLNWAPMQERSDWLAHWATKGVKPLFFVEWGLPHISSWSSYRGPNFIWRSEEFQSLWDAEFNAEYLGDEAYKLTDARIRSRELEEQLWATGKPFHWGRLIQHFRDDADNHIRMKAMFANDNWRCLRAWGISAMLPWDQEQLWRKKVEGFAGGARAVAYAPSRLKQPGIVADRQSASESWLYHPDANQIAPTALGEAFLRWNQPLCAFIGGGPDADDFTDKAHNYSPGETIRKQLVILNDTREAVTCTTRWRLAPAGKGRATAPPTAAGKDVRMTVPPGGKMDVPIAVSLPNDANGTYALAAEADFGAGGKQADTFALHVLPKSTALVVPAKRVALFDPKGMTAKLLEKVRVECERIDANADMSKYGILIVGREAVGLTTRLPDLSRVRDGLKVLVFEQSAETLSHRLGFRVNVHGLRRMFAGRFGASGLYDLEEDHLRDWRGAATLVAPHLPIEGVERDNPRWNWCGLSNTRVWRCGNRGCVASVLIEKPPVGDFRPLLSGGFDLQYAPLLQYSEGKGHVIFCQLDVTGRTAFDPAAIAICRGLLKALDRAGRKIPRTVLYDGDARGERLLDRLAISHRPYAPVKRTDKRRRLRLIVLGPGTKHAAELARDKPKLAYVVALGLGGEEFQRFIPKDATTRSVSAYEDQVGPHCALLRTGVSCADLAWRTKRKVDVPFFPARGPRPPLFYDYFGAGTFLCQVAPWMFDYKARPYLRTSYRRNVFLVSRLLHNLGATAKTPLLERLSTPGGRSEFALPGQWVGQVDREGAGREAGWWKPDFNPAGWKPIRVPGMFDEQFPGLTPAYNGLFWYRLRFKLPKDVARKGLTLDLGAIDDESWVWLNGRALGEVTKKTHPKDYWAVPRKHPIPPGLLRFGGENVLVVLVNDTYQKGGIRGKPDLQAPGAWLNSYYVQEPVADDDPYRYYRW